MSQLGNGKGDDSQCLWGCKLAQRGNADRQDTHTTNLRSMSAQAESNVTALLDPLKHALDHTSTLAGTSSIGRDAATLQI